jgi:hypothetical protein
MPGSGQQSGSAGLDRCDLPGMQLEEPGAPGDLKSFDNGDGRPGAANEDRRPATVAGGLLPLSPSMM